MVDPLADLCAGLEELEGEEGETQQQLEFETARRQPTDKGDTVPAEHGIYGRINSGENVSCNVGNVCRGKESVVLSETRFPSEAEERKKTPGERRTGVRSGRQDGKGIGSLVVKATSHSTRTDGSGSKRAQSFADVGQGTLVQKLSGLKVGL